MADKEPQQAIILVTGASGLLGSRVVPLLLKSIPDCRVIAAARNEKKIKLNDRVGIVVGDLRDEQFWASLPNEITHVVHLASVIPRQPEEKNLPSLMLDNVLPLNHLLEHSSRWPTLEQIIYSSSVSVYGPSSEFLVEESPKQPADLYGASKLAGEDLLEAFAARGVAAVSLRLSSLYAQGMYQWTVMPLMINRARQKQPLLLFGDGSRTQDFLHCDDAARAIVLSFQKRARGVYNVGAGIPTTMAELARTVSHVFTADTAEISFLRDRVETDSGLKLDIGKATRELGFEPLLQLESGLQKLKLEMETAEDLK
jgi:UDP-glucose 4-epimerase